ncbi:MAG: Arm DNA-binding domain-containing protein [Synergistaceae bacterium]|jgi:hypothetical protein|nr:Arm DNA-binding domain-containing protein [Synergistaceae bacterium]
MRVGKAHTLSLGEYPVLTMTAARERHDKQVSTAVQHEARPCACPPRGLARPAPPRFAQ